MESNQLGKLSHTLTRLIHEKNKKKIKNKPFSSHHNSLVIEGRLQYAT